MSLPAKGTENHSLPFLMRLKLALLHPLGYHYVSGRQLAVVYRMGRFHSLRGPRLFRISLWSEQIRRVVSLAPELLSLQVPNLLTKDGLLFEASVELMCAFDPRRVENTQIMKVIRRLDAPGGLHAIVANNAQVVLQAIFRDYHGEQIARNEATQAIQDRMIYELDVRLKGYAIFLITHDCYVREWVLPPPLLEGLEEAARRTVDVGNLGQFTSQEFQREIHMRLADALKGMKNGMPSINLSDLGRDAGSNGANEPGPDQRILAARVQTQAMANQSKTNANQDASTDIGENEYDLRSKL